MNIFTSLKANQKQTVVVYGTSLTAAAAWPEALKEYFDRLYPGLVTFINSAQSGQHSHWGLAQLPERVLSHHPDLILLEFSVNDAATKHAISVEQSEGNLDSMVKSLRQQNPQMDIILQTMNTFWDVPNDPQGKQAASDRPQLELYNDVYRQYAHEHDLPLLDHYPHWLALQREDREKFQKWLPDGSHPIPEASLAVTWTAIETLLEKARNGTVAQ
jgi:lysophospholipase L1-like esterase